MSTTATASSASSASTPTGRGRLYWALADSWTVVRRVLTHYRRKPVLIAWQLGFPIVSVLLYGYVLGGAMRPPGGGEAADYRNYLLPGMFVMTMSFGFMHTATAVVHDQSKGVIDRFRSMPMAPSAVVTGRGLTDLIVACAELSILLATALAMGWRAESGVAGAAGAFGVLLLLRFALTWVGVWLGLLVPNPEAAGGLFVVAFPLTMVSSVFAAPSTMPGWLGTVAAWNPLSATAGAARSLFGNEIGSDGSWVQEHAPLMAVVWPLAITAVFLPLAIRRYQRLSR
ncbi:ABC transporter permease [Streptomyces sp. LP05-1]|uniref:Transport permease protein n=1 Tax=Streptomyces pyxinae TaxID=2970734 RepID=A0ABT2CF47_9ACTN|nr:ABC transporter permease [Streptomyces sp. LP05-1]MCS0635940.1 ABC transporter permease [Streptomyces sp. LP05-1]